jgi:glutamate-ammonia-ligase adenylyltransferase
MRLCGEAKLYEVDPRLRPWGDQGEMVTTPRALGIYWAPGRELWERLAMTRMTPIAGDLDLAEEVIGQIQGLAVNPALPADGAEQVWGMRRRLEESVAGQDHIKRGAGGYVDVEFIAQWLRLGNRMAGLPTGSSTKAMLAHAASEGLLGEEAAADLQHGLAVLRRAERRMRLYAGTAISNLPQDAVERQRFARCAGYEGIDDLDIDLHLAREVNRRRFGEVFG